MNRKLLSIICTILSREIPYNTQSVQIFKVFLSWLIKYDGFRIEYLKHFTFDRKFSQSGEKVI